MHACDNHERHAYLIMSHDCLDELKLHIRALDWPENDIFCHIDTKAPFGEDAILGMTHHATLQCISSESVSWGGSSQVRCGLRLLETAARSGRHMYYHMLSGVDFPVKSHKEIIDFFDRNAGKNYIRKRVRIPQEKINLRVCQYHLLQDRFIGKKRNIWKYIDFASCYVLRAIGINRFRGIPISYSTALWSIIEELARYYVNKLDEIVKKYRYSYCADEVVYITELYNTSFKIEDMDLRFMEYVRFSKHDVSPKNLTRDDAVKFLDGEFVFARKFHLPESRELYGFLSLRHAEVDGGQSVGNL